MSPAASSARRLFTVVIASRCDDARAELLNRACESVRAMAAGLDYSIIVVANGARISSSVLESLATHANIRVIRLRSGSYPLARRVGAEMADSEFLAFLDDDDELIPDTLARKIAHFRQHPEVDVLVTDGLRVNGSTVTRIFPPPEARSADLIETMMHAGWGAGALTLRTKSIDLSAFDAEFRHLEWTLTTLELASRNKFGFLDEATYRYYEDTPNSLWKTAEHDLAAPKVWRRLLKRYAGSRYEETVRRRYGHECHNAASEYARRGLMLDAWRLHVESLRSPGGLAMVPFSARLLFASLHDLFASDNSGKRVDAVASNLDHSRDAHNHPSGGPAN
jgi:glycosyltransferase involved in cell wall biosynthesis